VREKIDGHHVGIGADGSSSMVVVDDQFREDFRKFIRGRKANAVFVAGRVKKWKGELKPRAASISSGVAARPLANLRKVLRKQLALPRSLIGRPSNFDDDRIHASSSPRRAGRRGRAVSRVARAWHCGCTSRPCYRPGHDA